MAKSGDADTPKGPEWPPLSLLQESGDALEAASPPFDVAGGAARLYEAARAHGLLQPGDIPDDALAVTGAVLEEEAPPFDVEAGAARLREAARARGLISRDASKDSAEQATRRFRVGEVPPLAEGFTDRPDTASGIVDALVPGSAVALVPGSALAEGRQNWLGACGKTQIAAIIAESLWRSGAIDALIWINAASQASVLSGFVEASAAATGIEPTGTAESVATRFVSWLAETSQPWLVVLDDLSETADLDGLWPEGPAGRVLVTTTQSAVVSRRRETRVIPVGFFSVREALGLVTERLSANPAQRQGAIDLIEALGREPLALAQAAAVIANSALACRDYRDYFVRRRQQIGVAAGEVPSAASVTWTLSLGQAEQLLPGQSVRLMLVLLALLDGHGIPGTIFNTPSVSAYLGETSAALSMEVDPRRAWDALLAIERAGLISINRIDAPLTILMSSVVQAAIRLAAPTALRDRAARAAANALLEAWPADEPQPWAAAVLRANAASLQSSAADALWADGCHPLLLRAGRSLDFAGLVGPAVEYWRELSLRCDNKLTPGHPDALVVASQLADAYLVAGYGSEDVRWYQRVLAERERELMPGHPAIIAARVSLARALIMAGEPADAVAVLLRAVAECEQFRGPGHLDTLSARDDLAVAYQATGDVAAASRLLTRNLADRERLQGPRDAETMATRDRLAAAYLAEGKIKDAITHYKRALSDREKMLGRGHPDTITSTANLAAAYQAAGRMPSAILLSEQCSAESERILGTDHADTLARLANLAYLYHAVGRVEDAMALLRETAVRCERALPYGDPLTQAVQQSLAGGHERSGGFFLPHGIVSDTLRSQRLPKLVLVSERVRAGGPDNDQAAAWERAGAKLREREQARTKLRAREDAARVLEEIRRREPPVDRGADPDAPLHGADSGAQRSTPEFFYPAIPPELAWALLPFVGDVWQKILDASAETGKRRETLAGSEIFDSTAEAKAWDDFDRVLDLPLRVQTIALMRVIASGPKRELATGLHAPW
jgi:tetratricopeptide (TPR) repeat protein